MKPTKLLLAAAVAVMPLAGNAGEPLAAFDVGDGMRAEASPVTPSGGADCNLRAFVRDKNPARDAASPKS